ncbi:hypothetical protein ElyMa_006184300 [Elysia marginata]|uniref:Secreted protein n=1 Tax=Elysia marginata TaxID=1093978 RepID=A0AAV4H287_9GAST|nr:hypothetical protein ElyMa_006184300 [Elysia marginata]
MVAKSSAAAARTTSTSSLCQQLTSATLLLVGLSASDISILCSVPRVRWCRSLNHKFPKRISTRSNFFSTNPAHPSRLLTQSTRACPPLTHFSPLPLLQYCVSHPLTR